MEDIDEIKRVQRLYDERINANLDAVEAAGQWGKKEWVEQICEEIFQKIEIKKSDKVIELGCGSGVLGNWLKNYCEKYYGIDLSELMLKTFKNEITQEYKVELIQAVINKVPIASNSFDVVIANGVSMYLDLNLLKSTIKEMKRLVKPDGKIFLGENVIPSNTYWEYVWFQKLNPILQNFSKPYIKLRIFLAKNGILSGKWRDYYREVSPKLIFDYFERGTVTMSDSAAMKIKRKNEGMNWKGNRRVDFLINLR